MTKARKTLVSINDTPYYHVVSRCVRRTFLCGYDRFTDRCYEHRRDWITDRLRLLSSIFAIDICAYAVMSNHYHLCLKLSPEQSENWSDEEVGERWASLFKGPMLFQRWRLGEDMSKAELDVVYDLLNTYRDRLTDLSWFMKCLNEPIAKQANAEDNCTGHFWESRFKSQALLTEEALLSCMAYVDLNPIRAKMAETPETSDFTSIKERIEPTFDLTKAIEEQTEFKYLNHFDAPLQLKPLLNFEGGVKKEKQTGLLYSFEDYLSLVDYTGRLARTGKRGSIPICLPKILDRLNITEDTWLRNCTSFEALYDKKFRKRRLSAA